MEKVEIESFTLDHTKVKAPYVRLISEEKGPNGDIKMVPIRRTTT